MQGQAYDRLYVEGFRVESSLSTTGLLADSATRQGSLEKSLTHLDLGQFVVLDSAIMLACSKFVAIGRG